MTDSIKDKLKEALKKNDSQSGRKPRRAKEKPHPGHQGDMVIIGDGNLMIGGIHHHYGNDSTDEDSD